MDFKKFMYSLSNITSESESKICGNGKCFCKKNGKKTRCKNLNKTIKKCGNGKCFCGKKKPCKNANKTLKKKSFFDAFTNPFSNKNNKSKKNKY
jgi:hypothetical protein